MARTLAWSCDSQNRPFNIKSAKDLNIQSIMKTLFISTVTRLAVQDINL